jgi:flagellar export protein FliJ
MAFKFSLATVLRVRGIVEEREERMLQQIQQEILNTLQAAAKIDSDIAQSNTSRAANLFKASMGTNLHAAYGELTQLKLHRRELESQLNKLNQLKKTQIEVYNAARRNREMLTEMREEKREVYESDLARREQSTLDDNYIARRGRA